MLQFLHDQYGIDVRKMRLFVCACCRRQAASVGDPRILRAVETAERFEDGLATEADIARARREVHAARIAIPDRRQEWAAFWLAEMAATPDSVTQFEIWLHELVTEGAWGVKAADERANAAILRDLFGPLPFRAVKLARATFAWEHGVVQALAQEIYDEGRWDELPILADALEDAGCREEEMLRHCRDTAAPHVKGCWVVDALLGKE
jgi:hypothetical protein